MGEDGEDDVTPREIIAWWVAQPVDDPDARAGTIINALTAAGFFIGPRELTDDMWKASPRLYEAGGERADLEQVWRDQIAAWEKANG